MYFYTEVFVDKIKEDTRLREARRLSKHFENKCISLASKLEAVTKELEAGFENTEAYVKMEEVLSRKEIRLSNLSEKYASALEVIADCEDIGGKSAENIRKSIAYHQAKIVNNGLTNIEKF